MSFSRKTWTIASILAFAGSLPVAIYGDCAPWLIAFPITIGGILVAALELADPKTKFKRRD